MKLSNVRKDLYAEVINLLPYGIEKSSHSLINNFGDIFILFGFGIVDLKKSYSTSFYYGIGSHKFSSLYNVIIKEKQLNLSENNYITACSTGQFKLFDEGKYPIKEYDITTKNDINNIAREVCSYLMNNVFSEWKDKNIGYLERKVNKTPPYNSNFSGLILAKFLKNEDYERIKSEYRLLLNDWVDVYKIDLESVISFLENHTTEKLHLISESKGNI